METRHWLFWDGECAYCRGWAQWVQKRDVHGRFHVIPFQQAPRPPMDDALYEACQKAVHVLTADGHLLRAGRAVLFILQELGYSWAGWFARKPFIWMVEWFYGWIASHRKWLSGSCGCE